MSNLSGSSYMASPFSKTQVNNFVNYTPPRPTFSGHAKDYSTKSFSHFIPTSTSQKYSPELESFRREINDQLREMFHSLSNDVNALKKDKTENKFQLDETRREIESTNTKVLQYRNSQNIELHKLREALITGSGIDVGKAEEVLRNHINNKEGYPGENLEEINNKIAQVAKQVSTLNAELEAVKNSTYVSKDQLSKNMAEIVDELEKKLNLINERVKERIEEMDDSMVANLKEKEKDYQKIYYDVRNIQSTMIRVSDQVNTYTHSADVNLEDNVKRIMNTYSSDIKNMSIMVSNAEQRMKSFRKEESMLLNPSFQNYQVKESDPRLKELDTIYQSIKLLEKEMRSKVDMIDFNINSVKRNLELELSVQMKQMVLPIQNNLDQFLQITESRFSALEDAVLNHMKRESYVMTAERASRMRTSHENLHFSNRPVFETQSHFEGFGEGGHVRKGSYPEIIVTAESAQKEKVKEKEYRTPEVLRVDEVDSFVNLEDTPRNSVEPYARKDIEVEEIEQKPVVDFPKLVDYKLETEENEEEEAVLTTIAQRVKPDADRNRMQKKAEGFFTSLEIKQQPDSMFPDFSSTSAMKSYIEMERPEAEKFEKRERPSSAKKKRPEIEVLDIAKDVSRESGKRLGTKTSPLNLDSKLILGAENFYNDDSDSSPPASRLPVKDEDEKKNSEITREISGALQEEANEEFHGNIKGLLKKSRSKKELSAQVEDIETRPPKSKSPIRGFYEEETKPRSASKDPFQKSLPLPSKGNGLGKNSTHDVGNQKQKAAALPPVDTKSIKDFNKGPKNPGPVKNQYGKGGHQSQKNMKQSNSLYGRGYMQQQAIEEDEESVEEIVYHVDEEGFLIDEQGNYLVDEQGNFLQLSPEQMREIENKDIIYE